MAICTASRVRATFALFASLSLLGSNACSSGGYAQFAGPNEQGGSSGAGAEAAGASNAPNNTAFLARAIPDAQHLDVTETCPGGVRGDKRCIPDRVLARPAVCYSGYRSNESPNAFRYPTEAEVKEDLELLVRAGYSFIRIFDSTQHAETVLKVISDNGFDVKVQLGVWIAGSKIKADTANQLQISKGIALANQYSSIVVGVSVGNETLDSWSSVLTDPKDLSEYIKQVRGAVTQPVTTDDLYPPFELVGYQEVLVVLQSVDYLSVHVYAAIDANFDSWDYKQLSAAEGPDRVQAMLKAAMAYSKLHIATVRQTLKDVKLDLPIVVGEAGWKSRVTDKSKVAEPAYSHEVNQQLFFDALEDWTYGAGKDADSPGTAFYFEAFDEAWKTSDDGWGLFDTYRNAKYVMWSKFPELKPAAAMPYTSADALYFK